MKSKNLVLLALLVLLVAATKIKVDFDNDDDIAINISDTEHTLKISATYPKEDSRHVHDFLRRELNMNDLPDLNHLEVKRYETRDHFMHYYIKSRRGYIKIVLDKDENSPEAYAKLRRTTDHLKQILAH
jgi:hypothetical protein